MSIEIAELTISAHKPYAEALAKLDHLERALGEVRQDIDALAHENEILENGAIRAEAALMIDEGSEAAAASARKKADAARAKLTEARRRLSVLEAAVLMQRAKVAELLPAAKQHIQQSAKAIHQPVVARLLAALREYGGARREHEEIVSSVSDALGGLYGSLMSPNGPDARTVDDWVVSIERQMREAGYEA